MKKLTILLTFLLLILSSNLLQAASTRTMCQQFFPRWDLNTCIQRQESAAGKISGWSSAGQRDSLYYSWVNECKPQHLLKYGVTSYVNYVGVEKCVMQKKNRHDELEAESKRPTYIIIR